MESEKYICVREENAGVKEIVIIDTVGACLPLMLCAVWPQLDCPVLLHLRLASCRCVLHPHHTALFPARPPARPPSISHLAIESLLGLARASTFL
jgi:hypothetical protein